MSNERQELIECLRLQEESRRETRPLDQLVARVKKILDAHPKETVVIEIDGLVYALRKVNWSQESQRLFRRHKGVYNGYRFEPMGKPIIGNDSP
jgi:hypothetical protein